MRGASDSGSRSGASSRGGWAARSCCSTRASGAPASSSCWRRRRPSSFVRCARERWPSRAAARSDNVRSAMAEDWRVEVQLREERHGARLSDALAASSVERAVHDRLGDRVVVSGEGSHVFLYADTEDAAQEAQLIVAAHAERGGWPVEMTLTRRHPTAEQWKPVDVPLPITPDEQEAERAERAAGERRETAAGAEWEVRVTLPSLGDAQELSRRLDADQVPHVRRWRYVLVGATDEDAARVWEARLRAEAPAASEIAVETTFRSVERHNPFAVFGWPTGNPCP